MNVKLSKVEYQHMIIELIRYCIDDIIELTREDDSYIDLVYFIESLKVKGVRGDLTFIDSKINSRSRQVAKDIIRLFKNKKDQRNITTLI